ncbi:ABC transporter family protein, partial [Reticulomyxa filosa]
EIYFILVSFYFGFILFWFHFILFHFENTEELDTDVSVEQKRIRAELTPDNKLRPEAKRHDAVHICGLRKVYKTEQAETKTKIAVKDLWFGIPQGQVFGFLGVNGAGKTTTLKMLTGDILPSSGNAFVYGIPIENQISTRRLIGYCPQLDAIFDLLTAYEHLKFYGIIKGLKGQELEDQIELLLKVLSLSKYKDKRAETYSGGNKRKLSAAIAMIGNPPVVFLGFICFFIFYLFYYYYYYYIYIFCLFVITPFLGTLFSLYQDEPSTGNLYLFFFVFEQWISLYSS